MTNKNKAKGGSQENGPAETGDVRPAGKTQQEKQAYQIDIFRDWCKSCGICAAFCPRHCIELDESGSPHVKNEAQCSGCGWCELHCPDFAISVRPKAPQAPKGDVD